MNRLQGLFSNPWEPLRVFEDRIDSGLCEKCDRDLSIFIEIRVEDFLIREPRVFLEQLLEQHPDRGDIDNLDISCLVKT